MDEVFSEQLDRAALRALSERSDSTGLLRLLSHFLVLGSLAALISAVPSGTRRTSAVCGAFSVTVRKKPKRVMIPSEGRGQATLYVPLPRFSNAKRPALSATTSRCSRPPWPSKEMRAPARGTPSASAMTP